MQTSRYKPVDDLDWWDTEQKTCPRIYGRNESWFGNRPDLPRFAVIWQLLVPCNRLASACSSFHGLLISETYDHYYLKVGTANVPQVAMLSRCSDFPGTIGCLRRRASWLRFRRSVSESSSLSTVSAQLHAAWSSIDCYKYLQVSGQRINLLFFLTVKLLVVSSSLPPETKRGSNTT